jgi:hypothetical protein
LLLATPLQAPIKHCAQGVGCLTYYMMTGINPFELQCNRGASLKLAVHKCDASSSSSLQLLCALTG